MFRFRVRKNPDPLLKFTQKTVLFQDISIFFVLKTELYLSSGTYFFFWKLVFHFTHFQCRLNARKHTFHLCRLAIDIPVCPCLCSLMLPAMLLAMLSRVIVCDVVFFLQNRKIIQHLLNNRGVYVFNKLKFLSYSDSVRQCSTYFHSFVKVIATIIVARILSCLLSYQKCCLKFQ